MRIQKPVSALVALMLFTGVSAFGQGRARQYSAPRPTVSPYLNLLRGNAGPIPNYHTLVRPQFQQQAINQQQRSINQQQQFQVQSNQQGLQQVQQGLIEVRQSPANPTGIGGGFMNFGHFYNLSGAPTMRR